MPTWKELISEAKQLGMTKEEVRSLINRLKTDNINEHVNKEVRESNESSYRDTKKRGYSVGVLE